MEDKAAASWRTTPFTREEPLTERNLLRLADNSTGGGILAGQYLSKSSDAIDNCTTHFPPATSHKRSLLSPMAGGCVAMPQPGRLIPATNYTPVPVVQLDHCQLRVPPSNWCPLGKVQWSSDPHINKDKSDNHHDNTQLDKWELLQIAARITSCHSNLYLFLGIGQSTWEAIQASHKTNTNLMLHVLLAWQQISDGSRKQLVTALGSAGLEQLAAQVQERSYYGNAPAMQHTPLSRTVSSKSPLPGNMAQLPFVFQGERRRGSAPILQRQMTQNTLRGLLQLRSTKEDHMTEEQD